MNLNKVFVLGNLTRDPELRQTPSGQAVCSFSIATNRFYTDSSGQKQQQTEFHNIVAWGRQAEIVNQYLRRGSPVLVEGRLQTRSWQDQQGAKHWRTEIIAERVQLGPKGTSGSPRDDSNQDRAARQNSRDSFGSSESSQSQSPREDTTPIIELPGGEDEIDVKDIPF